MTKEYKIDEEFITLGQFLKVLGMIPTGGAAKWFLSENLVLINGEKEDRRGRKLYKGDTIKIEDHDEYVLTR